MVPSVELGPLLSSSPTLGPSIGVPGRPGVGLLLSLPGGEGGATAKSKRCSQIYNLARGADSALVVTPVQLQFSVLEGGV